MSKTNKKAAIPIAAVIIEYLVYLAYNGSLAAGNPIGDLMDFINLFSAFAAFGVLIAILLMKDRDRAFLITAVSCTVLYLINPLLAFITLSAYLGIFYVDSIFSGDIGTQKTLKRDLFTLCFYILSIFSYVILRVKKWEYVNAVYTEKNYLVFLIAFIVTAALFAVSYKLLEKKEYELPEKLIKAVTVIGVTVFLARFYAIIAYVKPNLLAENIFLAIAAEGIILYKIFRNIRNLKEDN